MDENSSVSQDCINSAAQPPPCTPTVPLQQYVVTNFTEENTSQPMICERKNCSIKEYPPGTKMEMMWSQSGGSRLLCSLCYGYYLSKNTTQRMGTIVIYSPQFSVMQMCVSNNLYHKAFYCPGSSATSRRI
jgi:hypothetical protein